MLDSRSSVSLVESSTLIEMKDVVGVQCARSLWLVTASEDQLPTVYVQNFEVRNFRGFRG